MVTFRSFGLGLVTLISQLTSVWSQCNPLQGSCPPIPGFGGQYSIDFTKVNSLPSEWVLANYENVGFSSNGIEFTLAKRGDAPYIWTSQYLQYGYVEVVLETAPGIGVISSAVLLSDDLDEIDWEFSGNDFAKSVPTLQTNYYGKGITGDYDRGTQPSISGNMTTEFHTYVLNWTPASLSWYVDGNNVRTLYAKDCDNGTHQYPQTPSRFHLGVWDAGDPSVAWGTVEWAGGYTNMNGFPYIMTVQSVSIVPQNKCLWYNYTDTSGRSGSVQCISTNLASSSGSTSTSSSSTSTSFPSQPPASTTDSSIATSQTSETIATSGVSSQPSDTASPSSSGSAPSSTSQSSSGSQPSSSAGAGSSSSAAASSTGMSSSGSYASPDSSAVPSSPSSAAASSNGNYGSGSTKSSSSAAASSSSAAATLTELNNGGGPAPASSVSCISEVESSCSASDFSSAQSYAISLTQASSSQGSESKTQESASNVPGGSSAPTSALSPSNSVASSTSSASHTTTSPVTPSGCNHDNCLRNLLDNRYSVAAKSYCASVTAAPNIVPYEFGGCRDGASMESGCSCLMGMYPPTTSSSAPAKTEALQDQLKDKVKLMGFW